MARYKDAIEWLIRNDDTEWLHEDPDTGGGSISVSAAMVADLFGKPDQVVRQDCIKLQKKIENHVQPS